jgi:hypothetical protein
VRDRHQRHLRDRQEGAADDLHAEHHRLEPDRHVEVEGTGLRVGLTGRADHVQRARDATRARRGGHGLPRLVEHVDDEGVRVRVGDAPVDPEAVVHDLREVHALGRGRDDGPADAIESEVDGALRQGEVVARPGDPAPPRCGSTVLDHRWVGRERGRDDVRVEPVVEVRGGDVVRGAIGTEHGGEEVEVDADVGKYATVVGDRRRARLVVAAERRPCRDGHECDRSRDPDADQAPSREAGERWAQRDDGGPAEHRCVEVDGDTDIVDIGGAPLEHGTELVLELIVGERHGSISFRRSFNARWTIVRTVVGRQPRISAIS